MKGYAFLQKGTQIGIYPNIISRCISSLYYQLYIILCIHGLLFIGLFALVISVKTGFLLFQVNYDNK